MPKHPKEILVAETDDEIHFSIAHPKTLPWFANPVAEPGQHNGRGGHGHEHHQHAPAEQTNSSHGSASGSLAEKHNTRIEAHKLRAAEGEPELKLAHEATVIQLFYDLFFVANLTTFTGVHEINDADSEAILIFKALSLIRTKVSSLISASLAFSGSPGFKCLSTIFDSVWTRSGNGSARHFNLVS